MKNEIIRITAFASGGDGIGRLSDGRVCFVPETIPGELVSCRIEVEKKRFVRAVAEEIIEASKQRIQVQCPYYRQCPGCVYMHCDYAVEFEWKNRQFKDFLLRGKLASEDVIQLPFSAGKELFYRNKLTLHRAGKDSFGYYALDNRSVFPISRCLLAHESLEVSLTAGSVEDKALLRFTENDGALLISPDDPPVLHETIDGAGVFAVAGNGFFQTNIEVASQLVEEVKAAFRRSKADELLELYCGVGVFSIALAEAYSGVRCTGIELNAEAIDFARRNARDHQVADRCEFFVSDTAKALKKWKKRKNLTVLIDPPRSGMSPDALRGVIAADAGTVIYISCAADTLARDLKAFIAGGYRVSYAKMLDMFPRTGHFESITVLEKTKY